MQHLFMAFMATLIAGFPLSALATAQEDPNRWLSGDVHDLAHRGGAVDAPEETLMAMQRAVENGADALEVDFHYTFDGKLVLIHDDNVKRTTEGKGKVSEMTLAEIQALDAGYSYTRDAGKTFPYRGLGLTYPELWEVLKYASEQQIPISLELKANKRTHGWQAALDQMFILIDEYQIGHLVNFACLDQTVMDQARTEAYGVYPVGTPGAGEPRNMITTLTHSETIALMGLNPVTKLFHWNTRKYLIEDLGWTDADGNPKAPGELVTIPTMEGYTKLIWPNQLFPMEPEGGPKRTILTGITGFFGRFFTDGEKDHQRSLDLINRAQEFGLVVTCFTVNDEANLERLWAYYFDGIFTDNVSGFRRVINENPHDH